MDQKELYGERRKKKKNATVFVVGDKREQLELGSWRGANQV
jgi:hypothetical protein